MTDNDIIKGFAICNDLENGACKKCPYERGVHDNSCLEDMTTDVYSLINRQKAENDTLKAMIEAAEDHYSPLPFKGIFDEKIKEAKDEAIKEFAERLKKNAQKFTEYDEGGWGCTVYAVKVEDIDNTVEEITEETP